MLLTSKPGHRGRSLHVVAWLTLAGVGALAGCARAALRHDDDAAVTPPPSQPDASEPDDEPEPGQDDAGDEPEPDEPELDGGSEPAPNWPDAAAAVPDASEPDPEPDAGEPSDDLPPSPNNAESCPETAPRGSGVVACGAAIVCRYGVDESYVCNCYFAYLDCD